MKTHIKIICLITLVIIIFKNDCFASDIQYGPYNVGFETYKVYDDSRAYFLGDDTISRPLLIHFWFPTTGQDEGQSLSFKDYIDLIAIREDFKKAKAEIDMQSFHYVQAYSNFAKSNLGLDTSLNAQAILDSPVYAKSGISTAEIGTGFPLLIYAPSNSKASVQNHFLCEYLASHGFMIVSVASAGPNSIRREKFEESTMAQVLDMEYILNFCEDSLNIEYASLGVFGFSSGGNALSIFQMRNEQVGALLSLDGGQEYVTYRKLYKMPDFDLEKTDIPYCSLINNFENYSIYPMYHSIISTHKYIYRMPKLDHNGFVSYWMYFDSCSPDSIRSVVSISFEYLSECAVGFFSRYLMSGSDNIECIYIEENTSNYIRPLEQDYSAITSICNALLDNNIELAESLLEGNRHKLFGETNQINLLANMFSGTDEAIWLYKKSIDYSPDSWETYYRLGSEYKEKGEVLLSRKALLTAMELNPENKEISNLLNEISKTEL